ncbi:hypothetical protein [Burkholderia pseudomallei]
MIGGSGFGRGSERTILCNDAREGNDRFVLWLWDGRKCAGRTSKDARRESGAAGAGARRAGGFAASMPTPISVGTRDRRRVVSIGIGQSQINFSAMLNKPDDAPLNRKRLIAGQSENAAARAASNETKSSRKRSARAKFRAGMLENPYEGPPRRMIRARRRRGAFRWKFRKRLHLIEPGKSSVR